MQAITFGWTQNKQNKIAGRGWLPESDTPEAVVCLVHGFGEHCGRYEHVADTFLSKDVAMLSFDIYGHGQSGGKRGTITGYEAVLDDIDRVLEEARNRFPAVPLFLMGHSMGGNFAVNYALRRPAEGLRGLILSAPWLRLAFKPKQTDVVLAQIMNSIYPNFTQESNLDVSAISRDPEEVKKYENDPLNHSMIGPKIFLGARDAGEYALSRADQLALPTYIYHGTGDRITDFAASQEMTQLAPNATFRRWDGLYHEMHNEPEKAAVLAEVLAWIKGQLSR